MAEKHGSNGRARVTPVIGLCGLSSGANPHISIYLGSDSPQLLAHPATVLSEACQSSPYVTPSHADEPQAVQRTHFSRATPEGGLVCEAPRKEGRSRTTTHRSSQWHSGICRLPVVADRRVSSLGQSADFGLSQGQDCARQQETGIMGHPRWWVLLQSMSALRADWCPYFRGRKMWSPLQPDEVQLPFL